MRGHTHAPPPGAPWPRTMDNADLVPQLRRRCCSSWGPGPLRRPDACPGGPAARYQATLYPTPATPPCRSSPKLQPRDRGVRGAGPTGKQPWRHRPRAGSRRAPGRAGGRPNPGRTGFELPSTAHDPLPLPDSVSSRGRRAGAVDRGSGRPSCCSMPLTEPAELGRAVKRTGRSLPRDPSGPLRCGPDRRIRRSAAASAPASSSCRACCPPGADERELVGVVGGIVAFLTPPCIQAGLPARAHQLGRHAAHRGTNPLRPRRPA
jgi:hypothetical protein